MEIPHDLNKLLAELQQVARAAGWKAEKPAAACRPSQAEVDFFISQYNFDANAVVEQLEITVDGLFQAYMFAVHSADEVCLMTMWPNRNTPTPG